MSPAAASRAEPTPGAVRQLPCRDRQLAAASSCHRGV